MLERSCWVDSMVKISWFFGCLRFVVDEDVFRERVGEHSALL